MQILPPLLSKAHTVRADFEQLTIILLPSAAFYQICKALFIRRQIAAIIDSFLHKRLIPLYTRLQRLGRTLGIGSRVPQRSTSEKNTMATPDVLLDDSNLLAQEFTRIQMGPFGSFGKEYKLYDLLFLNLIFSFT